MKTRVCVVGGGPAGLMLGLLLARQGVETVVLEKHADFLRDFRGDTIHPSTLAVLDQLSLSDRVALLPGRKADRLRMSFVDGTYSVADFSRLSGAHPYILFLPQWDFLDLLAAEAQTLPTFTLLRSTEVTGLLRAADGTVTGVRTSEQDIEADLTVACDGRFSTVREELGLRPREFGAPMDVLWFRVARRAEDAEGLDMRIGAGGLMLCIDRNEYFQCAFVIAKGGYDEVRELGIEALRARVAELAPILADRVEQLTSWEDVKLLTVRVNRLQRWHVPGALLIGDAAHAMSPIGGVGVNLAVQDAVATARLLGPKLLAGGELSDQDLDAVRRRRQFPTVVTQAGQRVAQKRFVDPLLHADHPVKAPLPVKLLKWMAPLQGLPARMIGLGVRPERV